VSQPSPYTPGEVAREVPGRNHQLAEIDERLSYMIDLNRLVGRIRVDVGPRGLGKTSLLREVQRRAEARGALTAWVTAGADAGLVASIAAEIDRRTRDWQSEHRNRLLGLLDAMTVSVGVPGIAQVEATWAREEPGSPSGVREFEDVIRETVTLARHEERTGLVLLIDEVQSADATGLRTLAYAWQHLQAEGSDVPAAVFAAGLPNSPEAIGAVVTFSERFAYRPIGTLSDDASRIALVRPAGLNGVDWEQDALESVVAEAQGFPYTLQLFGDATWSAAGYPDPGGRLTTEHVERARTTVDNDLAALFRARWEKATPAEQVFLAAMAELGDGPIGRGELAQKMGVSTDDLGVPRARLMDKGLIDTAGHGTLTFTIPGFAAYVRAHTGAQ
jgi:AAA ATPase domain